MTTRQFGIALLICWLGSYGLFLAACLLAYWVSTEMVTPPPAVFIWTGASLVLAVLAGLVIVRTGRLGILVGLTVFVLGLAVVKFSQ